MDPAACHLVASWEACGFLSQSTSGMDVDLRTKAHRKLLNEIWDRAKPLVEFYAPKCSPWSSSQTTTKADRLQSNRAAEIPTLAWMVDVVNVV